MREVAMFLLAGAAVVSFFTFLSVTHWISARATERRERERLALLRRVVEQPESAGLIRELLREEDARAQAEARRRARRKRHEALQGGFVVMATGVGLSFFLFKLAPHQGIWAVGVMILLVGVVTTAFALISPTEPSGGPESE